MNLIICILAGLLVLLTVTPLSRSPVWWVRVLDFPRLQLVFLAAIVLILSLAWGEGQARLIAIAASACCFAYHVYWIYPYTLLVRTEVDSTSSNSQSTSVSILTANVLMTNRNSAGLIEIVSKSKPDILLALETDQWWEDKLSAIEGDYPFSIKCPLDNLYGMHVYSRLPLHEGTIEYLIEEGIPSIHTEIELDDKSRVRAHFVHPFPPVPEYSDSSEERDAELIVIAKSLQDYAGPSIVAGDLNDVAWSETTRLFRKISGLLDPRVGRGMYNTFNAKYWPMRWPLDHLFHSDHFTLSNLQRLEKFGSDHFALYTELALRHTHPSRTRGIVASEDDEDFAADKLNDQNVEVEDVPFNEKEKE